MDQIRFDFLGSINGTGRNAGANANANAAAEPGDAFSQILDQQLTRRADANAVPSRRAAETSRGDASDRSANDRPQVLKRRDSKTANASAAAKRDTAQAAAPKPKQPATTAKTCDKSTAKPQADDASDQTAEAAAGAQTAPETGTTSSTAETDTPSDTAGDQTGQQGDGTQQQAAEDETTGTEAATADPNLILLTGLALPLPLQMLAADSTTGDTGVATDADGKAAASLLQASLAAQLAGAIDLTASGATGKAQGQTQANAGGLKFGAVLAATAQAQPAGTDPAATLDATATTEETDPLQALALDPNGAKPKDTATGGSAKTRDAAQAGTSATAALDQNGKATATVVQPVRSGTGVTWSGTNVRNELSESLAVSAGSTAAADEAEFSNWSQYLGSGASGLGSSLSARQSAFLSQLKQNLQVLPPHEQIAVQIQNAMQNGNSRLTVSLHPAELGRVEVKLDIDKEKNVSATVIVDRPATLDLLRNDSKALERALQDAGLQTGSGSLSFNLRDGNGQNGSTAQNGTGTGGSGLGTGNAGSDVKADTVRPDVVATADGYVDLET
jgi:hypothetical protein